MLVNLQHQPLIFGAPYQFTIGCCEEVEKECSPYCEPPLVEHALPAFPGDRISTMIMVRSDVLSGLLALHDPVSITNGARLEVGICRGCDNEIIAHPTFSLVSSPTATHTKKLTDILGNPVISRQIHPNPVILSGHPLYDPNFTDVVNIYGLKYIPLMVELDVPDLPSGCYKICVYTTVDYPQPANAPETNGFFDNGTFGDDNEFGYLNGVNSIGGNDVKVIASQTLDGYNGTKAAVFNVSPGMPTGGFNTIPVLLTGTFNASPGKYLVKFKVKLPSGTNDEFKVTLKPEDYFNYYDLGGFIPVIDVLDEVDNTVINGDTATEHNVWYDISAIINLPSGYSGFPIGLFIETTGFTNEFSLVVDEFSVDSIDIIQGDDGTFNPTKVLFCSEEFSIFPHCFTREIRFTNTHTVFGLAYNEMRINGWYNLTQPTQKLWLKYRQRVILDEPSFVKEEIISRTSNGIERKHYSAISFKEKFETNHLPEEHHEVLLLAMSHDEFEIKEEGIDDWQRYVNESGYNITWQDFIPFYRYAKADFTLTRTPYSTVNEFC